MPGAAAPAGPVPQDGATGRDRAGRSGFGTGPHGRLRCVAGRRERPGGLLASGLLAACLLWQAPAAASDEAALCDRAAQRAAAASGVPVDLLRAIARAESGRTVGGRFGPWPWTTNVAGAGRYFPGRAEAEAHVRAQVAAGVRSIDIGCFQINLHWHGRHFVSAEAMFDPDANAAYAARFLATLQAEFGDWGLASGAYHSRTPERRSRYAARVAVLRGRLADAPPPALAAAPPPADPPRRAVPAPLLSGTAGRLGSLVPQPAGGRDGGTASLAAARAQPLPERTALPLSAPAQALRDRGATP